MVIFIAVITTAIPFAEANIADVNIFAVSVVNASNGIAIIFAFIANFAVIVVVAGITIKPVRNFVTAYNAQTICADGKVLKSCSWSQRTESLALKLS